MVNEEMIPEPRKNRIVGSVWFAPVVGLIMFIVGLAAGYFGRPLVTPASKTTEPETAAVQPATSPDSQDLQDLMEFLVEEARHIKGAPDAPVTIIEFSDFQ